MHIKIILNVLIHFSINEHVYNSKIPLITCKKHLLNFFKTFPILNYWSNNSDNIILI